MVENFTGRKNGFAQIFFLQICRKYINNEMPHLPSYLHPMFLKGL